MQWRDVDFRTNIITVRDTKNREPARHIPMNRIALDSFTRLREAYPKETKGKAPVFLNSNNDKLRGHRDWFEPSVEASGVKDYTWHCNRHAFGSRLVMAGVNLKAVQELMGHKTYSMVFRYAHLAPGHNAAAVASIVPADWATDAASVEAGDSTGDRGQGERKS